MQAALRAHTPTLLAIRFLLLATLVANARAMAGRVALADAGPGPKHRLVHVADYDRDVLE